MQRRAHLGTELEGLLIEPVFLGPKSKLDGRAVLSTTPYEWRLHLENRSRHGLDSVLLEDIVLHFPGGMYETLGTSLLVERLPAGAFREVGDFTTLFPAPGTHWLTCVVQTSPGVAALQRLPDGRVGVGWAQEVGAPPGTWRGPFAVTDRGVELQIGLNRSIAMMTGAVLVLTLVTTIGAFLKN